MECELKSRAESAADQMNLFCCGYSEQTIEKVDVFSCPDQYNTGFTRNSGTARANKLNE